MLSGRAADEAYEMNVDDMTRFTFEGVGIEGVEMSATEELDSLSITGFTFEAFDGETLGAMVMSGFSMSAEDETGAPVDLAVVAWGPDGRWVGDDAGGLHRKLDDGTWRLARRFAGAVEAIAPATESDLLHVAVAGVGSVFVCDFLPDARGSLELHRGAQRGAVPRRVHAQRGGARREPPQRAARAQTQPIGVKLTTHHHGVKGERRGHQVRQRRAL